MKTLKANEKVTYEKVFAFGKVAVVTATVVIVRGNIALLDNGDEIIAHY